MRFAMRSLIVLALPVLAFGWLSTVRIMPGPADWDGAFAPDPTLAAATFLVGGVVLVVASSLALKITDLVHAFRSQSAMPVRPISSPVVVVATFVGAGTIGMSGLYLDPLEKIGVWMEVGATIVGGFVALLAATVMIHSLVGLWSRPDLAMWPGRRVVIVLLLFAAVAATPVRVPVHGSDLGFDEGGTLIPLGERAWLGLSGDPAPFWRYAEDEVSGLL